MPFHVFVILHHTFDYTQSTLSNLSILDTFAHCKFLPSLQGLNIPPHQILAKYTLAPFSELLLHKSLYIQSNPSTQCKLDRPPGYNSLIPQALLNSHYLLFWCNHCLSRDILSVYFYFLHHMSENKHSILSMALD